MAKNVEVPACEGYQYGEWDWACDFLTSTCGLSGHDCGLVSKVANDMQTILQPHLVEKETEIAVKYSPYEPHRWIALDAPDNVRKAALLLNTIHELEQAASRVKRDRSRLTPQTMAPLFSLGILVSDLAWSLNLGKTGGELVVQQIGSLLAKQKGGQNSRRLSPGQEKLAMRLISREMETGIKKTPACVRVAAVLKKKHDIEVSKDTLLRMLRKQA